MKFTDAPRFGLKGRAAAEWLIGQGLALPQQPNTWLALADGSMVLRLGRGEYLLEGPIAQQLESTWQEGQRDLYRVPRYDAEFVLVDEKVQILLQEICALDTSPEVMEHKVLMTLAAGISVTLIYTGDAYRLWCDATYGDYMQHTLQEILN